MEYVIKDIIFALLIKQKLTIMTVIEQVIKTAIEVNNDCPDNESRLTFATQDDADTASEDLKELWPLGFGQTYGPFVSGNRKWYEVSIPRQIN